MDSGLRTMRAMHEYGGSVVSGRRGRLAGSFYAAIGCAALFCALAASPYCGAQVPESSTPTESLKEAPTQGQQTPQSPDLGAAQPGNRKTAQEADQTGALAEQIIAFLREEPEALSSVKNAVAQKLNSDPGDITDEDLFERIQRDATVRDLAAKALQARGFNLGKEGPDSTAPHPAGAALRPGADSGNSKQPKGESAPYRGESPPYKEPDRAQVVPLTNPYPGQESIQDLYTRFPSSEAKLRRFGSETFVLGTGNADALPTDIPAGPDYVLGPGDGLVVNLWGGQSGRLSRVIDRQGQIELPEAGTIAIAGLTIAQAQTALQKTLGTQFQNEHVEISLGRVRTVRVYVVGDVQRPGAYDVSSLSTPLNALYTAGGPTSRGSLRTLRQYRGKELIREIDLYDFLLHGVRSSVERLQAGDTLLVPTVGAQVSVAGMVRRPAVYELKGERGIKEILDLAGGVLTSASLKQIRVERIEAHEHRTMLSLQLPEDLNGDLQELKGFAVQDGDSVFVQQILPYNEQVVYLEGHVYRPGKYAYREGMTVTDILHSYQDVLPEPADHAELVRLKAPDFRPETIGFNLPDALIGNNAIKLQPLDSIWIFSRYKIDAPRVSIEGEVLRPGEYPMSQGMTLAELVRMAGGFKRSAFREEADLASYEIENGQKVIIQHSTVSVEKAVGGDKSADVVLKPGDVVSIRQLSGWQDIGASVTVTGEVGHAGRYGIHEGERLSEVLKRAGGFREGAYPAGAVLERVQVRELAERNRMEMIRRIETTPIEFRPGILSGQDQAELQHSAQQQREQVLTALRNHPASGRLLIAISPQFEKWEKTPADIEMRSGDTVSIPKRQSFVLVSGQVYNAAAITFVPGKEAAWYLRQAGGPTHSGDMGAVFIVRANGSVVGRKGGSLLGGGVLSTRLRPGDSVIVPEKSVGSQVWKNLISAAQIMSSVAITGAVAGVF